jgi:transposase
LRNFRQKSQI